MKSHPASRTAILLRHRTKFSKPEAEPTISDTITYQKDFYSPVQEARIEVPRRTLTEVLTDTLWGGVKGAGIGSALAYILAKARKTGPIQTGANMLVGGILGSPLGALYGATSHPESIVSVLGKEVKGEEAQRILDVHSALSQHRDYGPTLRDDDLYDILGTKAPHTVRIENNLSRPEDSHAAPISTDQLQMIQALIK